MAPKKADDPFEDVQHLAVATQHDRTVALVINDQSFRLTAAQANFLRRQFAAAHIEIGG